MVGFRDFDVVAEDVVEADLERRDAGAGALALFDLGKIGPAVAGDVAQFVEARIEAVANGAAVVEIHGRLVGERGENAVADFGDFIQARVDDPRGAAESAMPRRCLSDGIDGQRARQRGQIARAGGRESVTFESRRSRSRIAARSLASSARRMALA